VKMFSHLIYFVLKFYKFCTFDAICKDNAAINCITVQHKEGSFPSTLTGHTTLLYFIMFFFHYNVDACHLSNKVYTNAIWLGPFHYSGVLTCIIVITVPYQSWWVYISHITVCSHELNTNRCTVTTLYVTILKVIIIVVIFTISFEWNVSCVRLNLSSVSCVRLNLSSVSCVRLNLSSVSCVRLNLSSVSCVRLNLSSVSCVRLNLSSVSCVRLTLSSVSCVRLNLSPVSCVRLNLSSVSCVRLNLSSVSCVRLNLSSVSLHNLVCAFYPSSVSS
jgi:hypothetical protein